MKEEEEEEEEEDTSVEGEATKTRKYSENKIDEVMTMLLFTVWWLVYASPVILAVQRAKEPGDGKGRIEIKTCFPYLLLHASFSRWKKPRVLSVCLNKAPDGHDYRTRSSRR